MEYNVGDIIEMKKQHPCGSKKWEIIRVGVDFKLKCLRMWTYSYYSKRESYKNDKENFRLEKDVEACYNISENEK